MLVLCLACTPKTKPAENDSVASEPPSSVSSQPFGSSKEGTAVTLYTLKNKDGVEMKVMNYGGIIVSLKVPDKNGVVEDVVLGYDSLSPYLKSNPFFGALVGRYGNRIANGKFSLDGKTYSLAANDGKNHLHGGVKGFDKVVWTATVVSSSENPSIKLAYRSSDGEEGYPGNLDVEVVYTLTEQDELKIDYSAITDKKTVVNLTQHTYFNLTGNVKRDILDHQLMLDADQFLPVDQTLIPTGVLAKVANTPFDFKALTTIGARIKADHQQLKFGKGYDHCWIFTATRDSLKKIGTLYEPTSGRSMDVLTTEPAIQFYSGNFLNGTLTGKGGTVYQQRFGLCLETQHFPDSPNRKAFPSVVLNPGERFHSVTTYRFSAR